MEENRERASNPVESEPGQLTSLSADQIVHPPQISLGEDSAVTKAEKIEQHGTTDSGEEPSSKRVKVEPSNDFETQQEAPAQNERQKGVTPIKAESVIYQ